MTNSGRLSVRLIPVLLAGLVALIPCGRPLHAQDSPDLGSLSVDDLMNVEVTSVSRKGQKLADTAAAVFVITQEDIRRSGATSIPELLRMVPGLDVARINGNVWAISARGFNSQFANKLLVMIDGRSVYTPLFSGVFWDVQDTLLEDIDRIEVVRGPGGTLWGANAVNGVINIITKHTVETEGTLLSVNAGEVEGASGAARYGGSIGKEGHYRVWAKSFDRPQSDDLPASPHDAWTMERGGFRTDWVSQRGDNFTAQGDAYRGRVSPLGILVDPADPFNGPESSAAVKGEDLLFRWTAVQSRRSDTTFQAFYDHTARSDSRIVIGRRTFDIDFQHHLKAGSRNDLVWGANYRRSDVRATGPNVELIRDSSVSSIVSAFLQNELALTPRLRVTVGTKIQYDAVTHLQLQPTVRALFKPTARQSIWAAATSAVRTPSESELYAHAAVGAFRDGRGNTALLVLNGNPDLNPERVESYEAGYRWQVTPNVAFDATAFYNQMRDLVGTRVGQPFLDSSGATIVPFTTTNTSTGQSDGAEFFVTDAVTADWDVALGYSFFELTTTTQGGPGVVLDAGASSAPRHQIQLRSSVRLPRELSVDTSAYYVGRTGALIPSYLRLDAHLSWQPARQWELSITGQNLLRGGHHEVENAWSTPVQRTVYGTVTWRR